MRYLLLTIILLSLSGCKTPDYTFYTNNSTFQIEGKATDESSGVAFVTINGKNASTLCGKDSKECIYYKTVNLTQGSNYFTVKTQDYAGNFATPLIVLIMKTKPVGANNAVLNVSNKASW